MKIVVLGRFHGVGDVAFYDWRTKFGGCEAAVKGIAKPINTSPPWL